MLPMLLHGNNLFSQIVQQKATRQSATEAYTRGDYETAYREFAELLVIYPKDPLYKYYSGVSLVKLEKDTRTAVSLLDQAHKESAVVRNVPSDLLFWLGRAQQMSGYFSDAAASFNAFSDQSGRRTSREYGVAGYIQQCNERKGEVPHQEEIIRTVAKTEQQAEEIKASEIKAEQERLPDISPVSEGVDMMLSEALDYQYKADSIYARADEQRSELEKPGARDKSQMKAAVTESENLAAEYQKKADQKYAEAQNEMNATLFTAAKEKPDIRAQEIKTEAATVVQEERPAERKEPTWQQTIKADLLLLFEVTDRPSVDPDDRIIVDPVIPPGLIYRIQVAVFRNPVSPSYFKGLTPVFGFKAAGTDRTNYYAGMFRRHADAAEALKVVRQRGFKDAFIVSFMEGKTVSADRAAMLEKEWGRIPFSANTATVIETKADTLPPVLSFRIEVARSAKPVKDDVLEGMKRIAGTRGLDIETLDSGDIVYLIGHFITYLSASEFSDLLVRNGFSDSKVVARLGKKELPVETARELFEKIE